MLSRLLFLLSIGLFALVNLAPGGPLASLGGSRHVNPERAERLRRQLGLDKPIALQYVFWLIGNDWTKVDVDGKATELARAGRHMATHRLDQSSGDRQADPDPGPRARPALRHAVELLEKPGQRIGWNTRPGVLHCHPDLLVRDRRSRDPDPSPSRRMPNGVVHDVQQRFLEEDRIATDGRRTPNLDLDDSIGDASLDMPHHAIHQLLDVENLIRRAQGAAFDSPEVQQVGHQFVESLGLAVDQRRARPGVFRAEIEIRIHQRPGGRTDRRKRCAQVVRDGFEERALERVALPSDLCLPCL